jgi:antitoxin ParD1/3/4
MPTRNVHLTPRLDQVIEHAVQSGEYENASEVVRAALRLFDAHRRTEDLKMKRLAKALEEGEKSGGFKGDAHASVRAKLRLPERKRG